jgi:hypothetical protein
LKKKQELRLFLIRWSSRAGPVSRPETASKLEICGLDTPCDKHAGLLDHR